MRRLAVCACALAYGIGAAAVAARHGSVTTYAGRSGLATAADLAAGWSMIAAGLLVVSRPDSKRTGVLVTAAGFAWFAPDWVGWEGGPVAVRSLALLGLGLTYAFVVDAVASWKSRGLALRIARALVLCVYVETAVIMVGRALFRDPFDDARCWADCTSTNVFLVHGQRGLADTLYSVDLRFAVASGAALVLFVSWRLARAAAPGRRRMWPVLVPGAAFAALHAAWGLALLDGRIENPHRTVFSLLFFGRCAALIGLAGGLVWGVMRVRSARTALARLVGELGEAPAPGALEAAMAQAVGDPSLKIAYPLTGSARYVDAGGNLVDVPDTAGRAATAIVRDQRPLAVVMHDPAALDEPALVDELAAVARLAVDNERLHAEARAHLGELRASRARIVATGDAERRRLERDLHDGAQQHLLALSYDLRLARARAGAEGDDQVVTTLDAVIDEADTALDELRRLAHGIYPAVLEESGLAPALETLADEAPLAVEFGELDRERAPEVVERTAYVAAAEAISDAAARTATYVSVEVTRQGDRLRVAATDDGAPRRQPLTGLGDRVGALQGSLELGPNSLRAEIPCA